MRQYILLLLIGFGITLTSCRNDFDFESSKGGLSFSKDTVYLDTVFTAIGSSTYTLKVYNKSNKNISIPSLKLRKGLASKYRLMVDGVAGQVFQNVEMLAKDSMYIFVSVTAEVADSNPTDFLYTDQILFGEGTNEQKVELVTLIQDAYFIYPGRIQNPDNSYTYDSLNLGLDADGNPISIRGRFLEEANAANGNELNWTNTKPYVVYGYAAVPPNKTLVVDAGARIHFHAESGLIVANNASLQINGTSSSTASLENEVIFEGDRLEPNFSEAPGQWGTIWLTQGSTNNSISNLTIKNATVGLLVTGNDGTSTPTYINNTQIYNCSNVGILARTGSIEGKNVVINSCGQAAFAGSFGGSYEFTHCTFANYWSSPNQTAVLLDDYDGDALYTLTKADFKNCIIYGSSNLGINLKKKGTTFSYNFENCLIKFIDIGNQFGTNPLYQFSGSNFVNCLIASSSNVNKPIFKNPSRNELIIGENSVAKGTANATYSTFSDILNKPRNGDTDIGAYNWITFD
ncbi:hypothetical protein ACFSX9_03040 [Flavobacterium ardleyense]|uniref:Lipoprotein n=1 Tax=Flavobacterium ardleyense TaxID=2038737 RepID=A0ABW5Z5K6_9FLAO